MKIYSKEKQRMIKSIGSIILIASFSTNIMASTYETNHNLVPTHSKVNNNIQTPTKMPTKVKSMSELEKAIEIATNQLITKFTVQATNINANQLEKYDLYDHDTLGDYINGYEVSGKYDSVTREMKEITVTLDYKIMYQVSKIFREPMNGYTISAEAQKVFIKTKSIIKELGLKNMKSDYEKEKAVHDYIVAHTTYTDANQITTDITNPIYGVDGVLLNNNAVCQGYAETMKLFMDILGIECKIVTGVGKENQPHAWNLVKLDNEWYHVDATWNDPSPDIPGQILYSYFNVTDEMIKEDHIIDSNKTYPKAKGTKYFYYNDKVISQTKEDFEKQMSEMASNKEETGEIYCNYKIDINQLEKVLDTLVARYKMKIKYAVVGRVFYFEATY